MNKIVEGIFINVLHCKILKSLGLRASLKFFKYLVIGGLLPLFYLFLHKSSIQYLFLNVPTTRRVPYGPHGFRSVEGLLCDAEPKFELGPALQQSYALLS
jgi:hypothetical protein